MMTTHKKLRIAYAVLRKAQDLRHQQPRAMSAPMNNKHSYLSPMSRYFFPFLSDCSKLTKEKVKITYKLFLQAEGHFSNPFSLSPKQGKYMCSRDG
jgi:hypothetical protein